MPQQKNIKVVADRDIPYLKGVLDNMLEISYLPSGKIDQKAIQDADALLVRTRSRCDRNLLEKTNVKFIASATSGRDHLDENYCSTAGIVVKNAPGCNSSSVEQYLASALMRIRSIEKMPFSGMTLGIIGGGHVGEKVRQLGNVFGMKVLLNDPPRERMEGSKGFADVDFLLRNSDIVSIHVPLNIAGQDKTVGFISRDFLRKMKSNAWLINTSRGEVAVNEDLLKNPSDQKYILDVWENEPHLNKNLFSKVKIATPHIAGYSVNGKANATKTIVRELSNFFDLGLDGFEPEIPLPSSNTIALKSGNEFEKLEEAITFTYDIMHDDQLLRTQPQLFESLRNNYRKRWEFKNYEVIMESKNNWVASAIDKLGFNLHIRDNNDR